MIEKKISSYPTVKKICAIDTIMIKINKCELILLEISQK